MKTPTLRSTLVLSVCALSPPSAHAGGFVLPIHGIRALSIGGAAGAGSTGMDALWYNPSRLDETSIGIEVGFIDLQASYISGYGDQLGIGVENAAGAVPNPSLVAVYRLNDLLSFALGAYAPWSAQYNFPETGPQRYALVENDKSRVLYIHAAGALRLGDFRFGAGVQNVYAHIRERVMLSGYTGLFGHSEDPELDILSELELRDPVTITANFGVSYDLGPLTFGAALQLPFTVSGQADFRNRLPSSVFFDNAELEGDKALLEIPFPFGARGGVQWKIFDRWLVEADVSWEGWSRQQELVIDPQGQMILHGVPAVGDYVMKRIVIDRRMKDTFGFHFGSDAEIVDRLHLRAGVFYETSGFGDETFSVALLDDDKIGVTAGVSWNVGDFHFDAAAGRVFQGTREVSGSELKQINPTNPEQATSIGDGTYDTAYWVGGLAISWVPTFSE